MTNSNVVSLKTILWKVLNNPLVAGITYEQAAEFAIEAIRLIGRPLAYISKTSSPIQICDHKGIIPANIIKVNSVKGLVEKDDYGVAMTYATDSFHSDAQCEECDSAELTYTIQAGIITTSFKEGYVKISYDSLPVDEDNFPLVADDQDNLLAIEYYIIYRFLEPLWLMGKITDKSFNYIDQKKCWYMGAANTSLTIANIDHMEAIMNTINRLIINSNAHSNFFKESGKKERIRKFS